MALTDINLVAEREHLSGVQRIYRFGDYGLSLVNSPMLHFYPFAWEAAILKFEGPDPFDFLLTYDTPLSDDVEVFETEDDANAFIEKARVLWKA